MDFKKLAIMCGGLVLFGLIVNMYLFPKFIRHAIIKNTQLRKGNMIRDMFLKVPFPLDYRLYIFNYTNVDEILKGAYPNVQEIGPYYFEEWLEKYDVEDDEEMDTMSYEFKTTFIFRKDRSYPLTGDEIVTVPDFLLMAAVLAVKRDKEPLLSFVTSGLDTIFPNRTNPFLTVRLWDILYDGVLLNCDHEEFTAKAICGGLEENTDQFQRYNETHLSMAMLRGVNGTSKGRFTVYRGIRDIRNLGKVVSFNGETEGDTFDGEACNEIKGTDSTIFHPFMDKKEGLWAYSPESCSSGAATYKGKSKYMGLKVSEFEVKFNDLRDDPDHQCFCRDPPDGCPLEGVKDLSICHSGAPIVATKPHFLDVHPSLQGKVKGLNPDPKLHDMHVYFDLMTGTPVSAARRAQVNLEMFPVPEYDMMANLPTTLAPMMWIHEGIDLNKTFVGPVKTLHRVLAVNSLLKYVLIVGGLIGIGIFGYMEMEKTMPASVTPVLDKNPNVITLDDPNFEKKLGLDHDT